MSNLPNKLVKMDGRTRPGGDSKEINITSGYEEKEAVESLYYSV